MKVDTLISMIVREWRQEGRYVEKVLPPEAKFITGNRHNDAHLHYLYMKYGVEALVSEDGDRIIDYNVIDEKKFAWFLLRWS